jgi:TetR/AcrR family acrAB operon transcriptional repressor
MPRRTKQEAQATRDHLLDTAEIVFQRRGVSRTSLSELAAAAGVTRGAIYWHFEDKADLFNAMMSRVTLPMEKALDCCSEGLPDNMLDQLRSAFDGVMHKLVTDPQVRRVFEIAIHKVEYVDELSGVRDRHLASRNDCLVNVGRALAIAIERGQISSRMSPQAAAIGLHALIDGLVQNWILDPLAFDLQAIGRQALDAYLAGLAAASDVARSPPSRRSRQNSRTP